VKILHVITRLILGGAQENTLLSVEGLAHRHGHDVVLATGPAEGPEGDLFDRAKRGGIRVEVLRDLIRPVRPAADWRAYRVLRLLIREYRPDVVHTHSSKAGIVGRAAAWAERVPAVVHTIHGLPFGESERNFNNLLYVNAERYAARRCHAIVSVCDAMTEQALAAGVGRAEQFSTIYSGMEVDAFLDPAEPRTSIRRELSLDAEDIAFATVARLFERKGHEDILSIAPSVLSSNPRVRFVFLGDGILRGRLESEARNRNVAHAIRFTGLVAPHRIPSMLGGVDAVVHPSLREGLARVLPQALIVGRPVISYDIDGAREVVLPTTGCLLPPRDLPALRDAILRLAADTELRDRMGAEGRRRFADQFRHETMVDRLHSLYVRLLGASGH
jgi:glycosyltransferase involved in cell wall biosynthesis